MLTVSPVAAVPALAGAVVVSTTTLFLFTSSAISLPVLGAALAGAALWGGGVRQVGAAALDRVRRRYRDQVRHETENRVVGDPIQPEAMSLQRVLLEEIDARARARLDAMARSVRFCPTRLPRNGCRGLATKALAVDGALVRDVATGRVVAHVQETGLLHKALATGLQHSPALLDPLAPVSGLAGMIQDQRILHRLEEMQNTLGGLQALQIASLATSLVGIGVTVASTALMLRRLKDVDAAAERVEASVAELPRRWTEGTMRDRIGSVRTTLSRVEEAEHRRAAEQVMAASESDPHHDFDALHHGIGDLMSEPRLDASLLAACVAAALVCSRAQVKTLVWLDEKEVALRRTKGQAAKMRNLAWLAPPDILRGRVPDTEAVNHPRRFAQHPRPGRGPGNVLAICPDRAERRRSFGMSVSQDPRRPRRSGMVETHPRDLERVKLQMAARAVPHAFSWLSGRQRGKSRGAPGAGFGGEERGCGLAERRREEGDVHCTSRSRL